MEKFNWGIIGTGNITKTFVSAIALLPNSSVEAVGSRTVYRAKEYADEHLIDNYYGSYLELVQDQNIDAVYIATPMSEHYLNIKLALENNKHVLCEKSVTVNSAQLIELQQLAKERNLFLMEAMWTKCLPTYRKAKEMINDNIIGDIQFIDVQLSNMFEVDPQHRLFNKNLGGGALLDSGVYAIALATDFLGFEPISITASTYSNHGIDFDSYITLKYNDDKFANIITGFSSRNNCSATIVGTKGIIEFPKNFHYNSKLNLYDGNHHLIEELQFPFENGFIYQIIEAESCIKAGKIESDIVPLKSSIATLKIIDYCLESKEN